MYDNRTANGIELLFIYELLQCKRYRASAHLRAPQCKRYRASAHLRTPMCKRYRASPHLKIYLEVSWCIIGGIMEYNWRYNRYNWWYIGVYLVV